MKLSLGTSKVSNAVNKELLNSLLEYSWSNGVQFGGGQMIGIFVKNDDKMFRAHVCLIHEQKSKISKLTSPRTPERLVGVQVQ